MDLAGSVKQTAETSGTKSVSLSLSLFSILVSTISQGHFKKKKTDGRLVSRPLLCIVELKKILKGHGYRFSVQKLRWMQQLRGGYTTVRRHCFNALLYHFIQLSVLLLVLGSLRNSYMITFKKLFSKIT